MDTLGILETCHDFYCMDPWAGFYFVSPDKYVIYAPHLAKYIKARLVDICMPKQYYLFPLTRLLRIKKPGLETCMLLLFLDTCSALAT